jgi:DNA ligase-1
MPDLQDGETLEMQGSGSRPYVLKNTGGVYSCTCPAWRNQSLAIERRTCKHLRKLRGDAAEEARVGSAVQPVRAAAARDVQGPPLLLAESWNGSTDLTGWWLSEKLDGVRAYWDGKQFLSRQGNTYHAPDWFLAGLPSEPLDGELWLGRKQFQRAVSIVRRQDKNDLWKEIRYLIFDAPSVDREFEQRLRFVKDLLTRRDLPYAGLHEHSICKGMDHLQQELARVSDLGGEGLMLRQPQSRYAVGRSTTLLKVKRFQDAEARVVGHEAGKGRHKGRLGALLVEMDTGVRFAVGTGFSDAQREQAPAIGSVITFRYQELSDGGVPRFPSYVGLRQDTPIAARQPVKVHVDSKLSAAAPLATGVRRFEFAEGNSSKFWEITVAEVEVCVRFGRIGTTGQKNVKTFPSAAAAAKHAAKLVQEKTDKGYREIST